MHPMLGHAAELPCHGPTASHASAASALLRGQQHLSRPSTHGCRVVSFSGSPSTLHPWQFGYSARRGPQDDSEAAPLRGRHRGRRPCEEPGANWRFCFALGLQYLQEEASSSIRIECCHRSGPVVGVQYLSDAKKERLERADLATS